MPKLSSRSFSAKLLLFGEYSILFDSKAIVLPLKEFSGHLAINDKFNATQLGSHRELWWLYSYCLNNKIYELNLDDMKKDLQKGLCFESNIPQGAGIGSSGALVAAVFWQYAHSNFLRDIVVNKNYSLARKILARIESHFHEQSSGVDPLSSLVDHPLLVETNKISKIDFDQSILEISIVDTKMQRKVKRNVSLFLEKCAQKDFLSKIKTDYLDITNNCVDSFIKKDKQLLKDSIKKLSKFQLNNFEEFIPKAYALEWERSLKNDEGLFKLCGAGGGHLMRLNC